MNMASVRCEVCGQPTPNNVGITVLHRQVGPPTYALVGRSACNVVGCTAALVEHCVLPTTVRVVCRSEHTSTFLRRRMRRIQLPVDARGNYVIAGRSERDNLNTTPGELWLTVEPPSSFSVIVRDTPRGLEFETRADADLSYTQDRDGLYIVTASR